VRTASYALTVAKPLTSARIGALVFTFVTFVFIGVACAQGGGAGDRDPGDVSQRLMQPTVVGISYDAAGERVFASLCRVRLYDCDLAEISVRGAGSLRYFRSGGSLGYIQPTVSANGRFLYAARVPRSQRPSQRNADQELVQIDLMSGTETVISPSDGFRYERLISIDETNILAVQSYLSVEGLRCRGDFCTNAARVVLFGERRPYVLPDVGTVGEVGRINVSIVPLGAGGAWIKAAAEQDVEGVQGRTMVTWLFNSRANELSAPTSNVNVARGLFESFANSREGVRWRWEQLFPAGGPLELRPFPPNRETLGGVEQVSLTADGQGVRLTKRRDGMSVRLDLEVVENRGASPWRSLRRVSVAYAPPT